MKFTFSRTFDGHTFDVDVTCDKHGADVEVEGIRVNGGTDDAHDILRQDVIDYLYDAARAEAYAEAEDIRCYHQELQRQLALELHHS